jgi:hypothetical protein
MWLKVRQSVIWKISNYRKIWFPSNTGAQATPPPSTACFFFTQRTQTLIPVLNSVQIDGYITPHRTELQKFENSVLVFGNQSW